MTKDEAVAKAKAYVAKQAAEWGLDLVVLEKLTIEKPFGWVFFYNSRIYAETGDESQALVGNAPIIVDARSGEVHVTGTARPLEYYIRLFEEHGTCQPRR